MSKLKLCRTRYVANREGLGQNEIICDTYISDYKGHMISETALVRTSKEFGGEDINDQFSDKETGYWLCTSEDSNIYNRDQCIAFFPKAHPLKNREEIIDTFKKELQKSEQKRKNMNIPIQELFNKGAE